MIRGRVLRLIVRLMRAIGDGCAERERATSTSNKTEISLKVDWTNRKESREAHPKGVGLQWALKEEVGVRGGASH